MTEPVNRSSVDPIHPAIDGMKDGCDGVRIVLRSPAVCPTPAADGPGPESDGRELEVGGSQLPSGEFPSSCRHGTCSLLGKYFDMKIL